MLSNIDKIVIRKMLNSLLSNCRLGACNISALRLFDDYISTLWTERVITLNQYYRLKNLFERASENHLYQKDIISFRGI